MASLMKSLLKKKEEAPKMTSDPEDDSSEQEPEEAKQPVETPDAEAAAANEIIDLDPVSEASLTSPHARV